MANVAHAKPLHDYHLVNPSPWPAVGATSAFVAAVGLILWMHQTVTYAPLVLGAGVIGGGDLSRGVMRHGWRGERQGKQQGATKHPGILDEASGSTLWTVSKARRG